MDADGTFERFLRTAFNNVGVPNTCTLVPISLDDGEKQYAAFRFVRTFSWNVAGTLILFDDVWNLYLDQVVESVESSCDGYKHVVQITRIDTPKFVLKVDDFHMGFKEICEYVKWLVLEAGFFEVTTNNRYFD